MANSAEEFFAEIDTDNELDDFVDHMKKPVEEIPEMEWDDELGPIGNVDDPENIDGGDISTDDTPDPNEQYFNYEQGHRLTAELGINAIDRLTSNLAALFTDKPAKYYREKINKEDHANDVNVTAAMIKKYEVKIGLEWWFLMAIIGRYSNMVSEGMKEARKPNVDVTPEKED
jgi:hypothetical protein